MATRKVTVTITRNYSKTATIEVDVDENVKDEALQEFLATDVAVATRLENALSDKSLDGGDTEYEYQDPTNGDGGHL